MLFSKPFLALLIIAALTFAPGFDAVKPDRGASLRSNGAAPSGLEKPDRTGGRTSGRTNAAADFFHVGRASMVPDSIGYIDGHADTITRAMESGCGLYENELHIDFKRLSAYAAPVQVFTVWCADQYVDDAFNYANAAIDFFEKELAEHADMVGLVRSMDDIARNAAENKISALLALEGGEPLMGSIENLEHFYSRGVRLITLTWNRENALGYGVGADSEKGLKPFGAECVKKMDELGIIIDVSHINEAGFWDVDALSARPYMASHSNAYSVTPDKRNLKDAQIKALVKKGGVIGVNFYTQFLTPEKVAGIDDILRHMERFMELGAGDNIGLGGDFDGINKMPAEFTDVSSVKLLERRVTGAFGAETASKLMSRNFYDYLARFFQM